MLLRVRVLDRLDYDRWPNRWARRRKPRLFEIYHRLGDEHDEHQPARLAVHPGGEEARCQNRGDRSGPHSHREAGRLAHPDPAGTDGALALGMMNVIITEDLVDHEYVDKYTLGYDELKARAEQYPPERVASITGISVEYIRKLAREYATIQPSAIREGVALERSPGGGDAIRLVS